MGALTLTLFSGEREEPAHVFGSLVDRPANPAVEFSKTRGRWKPSLGERIWVRAVKLQTSSSQSALPDYAALCSLVAHLFMIDGLLCMRNPPVRWRPMQSNRIRPVSPPPGPPRQNPPPANKNRSETTRNKVFMTARCSTESIDTRCYFAIFKPFSFQDSKPPSISMTE